MAGTTTAASRGDRILAAVADVLRLGDFGQHHPAALALAAVGRGRNNGHTFDVFQGEGLVRCIAPELASNLHLKPFRRRFGQTV